MSAPEPARASLGIFAKTFAGSTPHAVLAQARASGYDVVQYNMACSGLSSLPSVIAPDVILQIRDAARDSSIGLAALSATYNIIHPEIAVRDAGQRSLADLARSAKELNIPLLTLCTGSRNAADQWAPHADNGSVESWRVLLESMESAIVLADRHDLMLGIEPEPSNVVASASVARRLLDELASARVGIVLDAANLIGPVLRESAATRRDVISHAVDHLADRIVLVHAKDRAADGSTVAPGDGVVDFDHYFVTLAAGGVRAPVITHGLSATDAQRSAAYLRDRMTASGLA